MPIKPRPEPLGLLVGIARRSIKQAVTKRLRRRGLSYQQFWLLVAILEYPGRSLRALAERMQMDSPTASRIVGLLVKRGLVGMLPDPDDRRRQRIRLTPRGASFARRIHPLALETREAVEAGFREAEKQALRAMLYRIIRNVQRWRTR